MTAAYETAAAIVAARSPEGRPTEIGLSLNGRPMIMTDWITPPVEGLKRSWFGLSNLELDAILDALHTDQQDRTTTP